MTLIGKIVSLAPTLDSNTGVSDAIEYLVASAHAFIQHEVEMVGIVSAERLLAWASASNMDFMEPIITIKGNEPEAQAEEIMKKHGAECVAVTNQNGVFVCVTTFKKLNRPKP